MEEILKTIEDLTSKEQKTIEQMGLKLSEETGECSQAILAAIKAKGSEYKEMTYDNVKEECIDAVVIAASIFFKAGGSLEEFNQIATEKISKWKDKSIDA